MTRVFLLMIAAKSIIMAYVWIRFITIFIYNGYITGISVGVITIVVLTLLLAIWPTSLYYNWLSQSYAPVQALLLLSSVDNDEYLLLLVPSNFSNSEKKYYKSVNVFHSYGYNKNVLPTVKATKYILVISCQVWKVLEVFVLFYFQLPAPRSELSENQLLLKKKTHCLRFKTSFLLFYLIHWFILYLLWEGSTMVNAIFYFL